MKKRSLYKIICSISILTLLLSSCAEEPPEPVDPGGSDPRDRFTDLWAIAEISQDFGSSTYNVTIADSSNASYILIAYLYGFNKKCYATVSGNSFLIPVQLIEGNNVSAIGQLVSTDQINMTYYVQSTGSHTDTVTATLTK